jgi:hypothetical protein
VKPAILLSRIDESRRAAMKAATRKRKQIHRTEAQWRGLVAAWKSSGKTKESWARENGVSFESLRRWSKRLRHTAESPAVVELSRKPILRTTEATTRVTITRDGELELSGAISEEILRTLIRLLREPAGVR